MKKFIALFGSVALLSACTFTVSTEMKEDTDDTVPVEDTIEMDMPAADSLDVEEAVVEEDDGTVDGATNEDAGGDGTNTAGGDTATVEVEVQAETE